MSPAFKTGPVVPRSMDWRELMELHGAFERSAILHAAVKHDIFTHLSALVARADGLPVPAAAVAAAAGTEPRATELLLNALAGLGLAIKEPPEDAEAPIPGGAFRTSATSERHLVEGADEDFRGFINFDAANWTRWGALAETIATGLPPALDHMYQSSPDATARFIEAMERIGRARGDVEVVATRLDLSRAVHLLDVGGGSAAYSLAFLARNRHLHVTLIDLPNTLEVTKRYVAQAPESVRKRIRLVACDYNKDDLPVPPKTSSLPDDLVAALPFAKDLLPRLSDGYDVAWVSNIVHGEDEVNNRTLAAKIFHALRPGGRMVIKEHVMDPTLTQPTLGAVFAVNMLLFTRAGRCYGFDEMRRWYEDAGFVDVEEEAPRPPLTSSIVTAKRPGGGLHEELARGGKLLGEGVADIVRSFSGRQST